MASGSDDSSDEIEDDLNDEKRQILKSIDSFEDQYKTYRPKAEADEEITENTEKCENTGAIQSYWHSETSKERSGKSKQTTSRHFSNYRIASGQGQQQASIMDHQGYSFSEYPICRNSSCAQVGSDAHVSQSESCYWTADTGGGNSQPLPESGSRSDDTIVNQPGVCTASVGEEQSTQCCPMGTCCYCRLPEPSNPGQELPSPGPMTFAPFPFMSMGMPMFYPGNPGAPPSGMYAMPNGVPANGMYAMSASANGMYGMPGAAAAAAAAMGMNQDAQAGRGVAGQATNMAQSSAEVNNSTYAGPSTSGYAGPSTSGYAGPSTSGYAGPSTSGYSGMSNATQPAAPMGSYPAMPGAYHPSMAGSNTDQNPQGTDAAAAYELVQKYNQSIQQYLATAEQNVQQTMAQAQSQSQTQQHATPQVFSSLQPGMPQSLATAGAMGAQQYYPGGQEVFTSGSMGQPQQYFPNAMSMAMPSMQPTAVFGMNAASGSSSSTSSSSAYYASPGLAAGGAFNDSLQTQTVYSSDYKPFAAQGNNFNHFPNGIDIGLAPESSPAYSAIASRAGPGAGVPAEMCSQLYGMGMGMGMDVGNQSFPLSQMNYASYPCEMQMQPAAPAAGGYLPSFNTSGKSI